MNAAERRAERRAERIEKRRRRRRRRKGNPQLGPGAEGPVSFFSPVGGPRELPPPRPDGAPANGGPPVEAVVLGPDGQPLPRKRRRRRRRGRGGRGRPEFRATEGDRPDGPPPPALPEGGAGDDAE
jgi:hypothetical protein